LAVEDHAVVRQGLTKPVNQKANVVISVEAEKANQALPLPRKSGLAWNSYSIHTLSILHRLPILMKMKHVLHPTEPLSKGKGQKKVFLTKLSCPQFVRGYNFSGAKEEERS